MIEGAGACPDESLLCIYFKTFLMSKKNLLLEVFKHWGYDLPERVVVAILAEA